MGKYPFYIRLIRFIGWYAFIFYLWANNETFDSHREGMYWDEREDSLKCLPMQLKQKWMRDNERIHTHSHVGSGACNHCPHYRGTSGQRVKCAYGLEVV